MNTPVRQSRKTNAASSSVTVPITAVKKASRVKQTAPTKHKVKMMPEKKFQELKFKMKLNLTITNEERLLYREQRVLRDLKKFLG